MANYLGNETVSELGEDAVLAAIIPMLPASSQVTLGPGDDAAGLRASGLTLLSTDTMVSGRDFSLDWSSAENLARKAVASNFADIAAMGVVPTGLLVALTVPSTTTLDWMVNFARGLSLGMTRLAPGTGVIGGDLALGSELHIAITSVGVLSDGQPVTRAGANPGEVIAIAGRQGWSAAGLDLLRSSRLPTAESAYSGAVQAAVAAHLRPEPPILLGDAARLGGATSMLDVSDGLVRDATRIANASAVALSLDPRLVHQLVEPLVEVARELLADVSLAAERALEWVLQGGEDHCLLATFPAEASLPVGFVPIGTVVAQPVGSVLFGGKPIFAKGWDSLRSASAAAG